MDSAKCTCVLLLLFGQLFDCIYGYRRLEAGLGEGQVVLYPAPFYVVDGLDFQGMALAYLEEQGINTSIEVQSWMKDHAYNSLRAMLDDDMLYKAIRWMVLARSTTACVGIHVSLCGTGLESSTSKGFIHGKSTKTASTSVIKALVSRKETRSRTSVNTQ
ncbi:thioredoxin reductase 1 [Plasmopara halstedii]|uniref:Thioredoxin reductase 1 n=1 Tax=Plasmopara halstedii TaxID=4781 RepID=A0A0P1B3K4_PLAHL|nr:thioredoxin reductase 1 [Plasmopara halstedii]CEG48669.1 thioredoxin reductase 1 [Plasmopara halstedii]|eukprot:XP_024585038.1 thioredoxin reductase 1 [Plasmopara halstedii]